VALRPTLSGGLPFSSDRPAGSFAGHFSSKNKTSYFESKISASRTGSACLYNTMYLFTLLYWSSMPSVVDHILYTL
jgi:hypothetical protein